MKTFYKIEKPEGEYYFAFEKSLCVFEFCKTNSEIRIREIIPGVEWTKEGSEEITITEFINRLNQIQANQIGKILMYNKKATNKKKRGEPEKVPTLIKETVHKLVESLNKNFEDKFHCEIVPGEKNKFTNLTNFDEHE